MDLGFHVIFKRCRFKGGLFKNVNVQAGAKNCLIRRRAGADASKKAYPFVI